MTALSSSSPHLLLSSHPAGLMTYAVFAPISLTFMARSPHSGSSSVIRAKGALVSAAVIYFYDYLLTLSNEIELYRHSRRDRRLLASFVALRYLPALYQLVMVVAMIYEDPTPERCAVLDKIAIGLDTAFQLSYILIVTWRVHATNGPLLAIPLALLGLASPIINLAVSNPSAFPSCRVLNTGPTARIIFILPCLRAAFDAAATLALIFRLWRHIYLMAELASNTVSFVLQEEIRDIILIFAIMAMEAVFAQIPSARTHGRNFIVPFVDSLTAILTTRFMLELAEKGRGGRDRRSSRSGPRIYDPTSNSFVVDNTLGSVLPTTTRTLVDEDSGSGPELPKKSTGDAEDGASSLRTASTRSIGWNRVGSCLGARSF
ncbi:hypothetical protein FB45DRAFT_927063 [Roridomyces roridus]|uniref:DUF6533 domain-containing protein n=1 Tax=Roridomyces roridus TaxID=1738132 RepID=A0AAD7BID6_9AGAR|nr:hypothetical protein FB45DRAFT_927063 [Roridomyces roridus]